MAGRPLLTVAPPRKKCHVCQKNLAARDGFTKGGFPTYHRKCSTCQRRNRPQANVLRNHLKPTCERCGFEPEHRVQLHIDHIVPSSQGGSSEPANLQTLCANCHALKSRYDRAELPWPVTRVADVLPLFAAGEGS